MIRKATLEDIDALNELLKSLFEQENEFQADAKLQIKALKKIINSKKIGDIFVYERNKKVIAMVNVLYSISTALGKKVAILEDMVVLKKYRQKGYGTKLLSYVLKRLEKDGVKRITLLSDFDNDKAHEFYKKQGFKKSTMVVLRK
ncbi:GNAT family N-acetyltransferase [Sulfurimonas lithotrophica]|uniref:GNAT family N-acetyltransferase n=1 Tax=Sulfurimonas lithotrophica TaxID=2590022 RepID=A0A5P8NZQ3_9BACT|nr:GNAT family N-acetyltransferase [Sulfurimonas lithotrophica]QFR48840.1 GNAT family N-acetyltransferase [Sulfurimonas lithotrophica]